ncbi:hypothetical protein LUZ60_004995 [Juncus effusus]|nr:hypothetical protein LUZ60_004995 [Juncus effusus]
MYTSPFFTLQSKKLFFFFFPLSLSMHHLLPFFLFLFFLLSISLSTSSLQFREAPQFYNSPSCSSVSTVHVAMTLDSAYLRGSIAAIHSVLQHSSCPESVQFHFIVSSSVENLNSTIRATFPSLSFEIYKFDESRVSGLISVSVRKALDKPLNYARSYLPILLPDSVRKIVYLDSDLVLVDDIARLASTPLPDGIALAAPQYCKANFTSYFTPKFWSDPSLSNTFRGRNPCYFNTGVMVMDLSLWRANNYTHQIEQWMKLQKKLHLYNLGSLPPFLLVFAGNIAGVDHRWNQHGLGGDNYRGLCRNLHPGKVSLLHWSGKGKPWVRIDAGRPCPLDALWKPYDLLLRPSSAIDDV